MIHYDNNDCPVLYYAAADWHRGDRTTNGPRNWEYTTFRNVIELRLWLDEQKERYAVRTHRRLDRFEIMTFVENHENLSHQLTPEMLTELKEWADGQF